MAADSTILQGQLALERDPETKDVEKLLRLFLRSLAEEEISGTLPIHARMYTEEVLAQAVAE